MRSFAPIRGSHIQGVRFQGEYTECSRCGRVISRRPDRNSSSGWCRDCREVEKMIAADAETFVETRNDCDLYGAGEPTEKQQRYIDLDNRISRRLAR